jgi:hypothetical protein
MKLSNETLRDELKQGLDGDIKLQIHIYFFLGHL